MTFRIAATTVSLAIAAPAAACDIALVLAVDVSGSVDAKEYAIQMDGLAVALGDPAVSEALVRAKAQVTLLQWTGAGRQAVAIPWVSLESFAAVTVFADEVADTPRVWRDYATAIGEAIEVAVVAFDAPQVAGCARQVIDISGDGASNEGILPEQARISAAIRGITINAIAIEQSEAGLADYYRQHVITGPGSFAVRAATFVDYPERIRQKLLRELVVQLAATD